MNVIIMGFVYMCFLGNLLTMGHQKFHLQTHPWEQNLKVIVRPYV